MSRTRLVLEVLMVFGVLPLAYASAIHYLAWTLLPLLIAIGIGTFIFLRRDPTFDHKQFWNPAPIRRELPTILAVWAGGAVAGYFLIRLFRPELLFNLPRFHPLLWAAVCLLYPLLSVYPQELFWRALFFHRYRPVFRSDGAMILASAVAFGWIHIVMRNWLAVGLSFGGGLLFGWRYARTRSLATTSLEHALWGILIFTLGLGTYFYAR